MSDPGSSGPADTSALARAARALIAREAAGGATAVEVATGVVRAWGNLCLHLAHIVGDAGILALFDRSVALARGEFPWLPVVGAASSEARWQTLRTSLEAQAPEESVQASVAVASRFLTGLGRLIGTELTLRLLQEMWPEEPPGGTFKETT
jgi:hypothetical protein